MSDCSSCPSNGKCGNDSGQCGVVNNPANKIKNVIGVMSGKGGVGKSTISAMLASELKKKGYRVGLLDADITGPSACRLMGVTGKKAYSDGKNIIPVENEEGIKVISLNLLLPDENQPVVWRGSLLSSCVVQFWNETLWGELDYLIVDMPPGTGDITLTVMQSIPLAGVIVVTLPQDMVAMIVNKAINMAKLMKIKILGVVENMSYTLCPNCGEKIRIFSGNSGEDFCKENDTVLLGSLPVDPDLAALSSEGKAHLKDEIADVFEQMAQKVIKAVENE